MMFSSQAAALDRGLSAGPGGLGIPGGAVLHFAMDSQIYAEGDIARSFYKVLTGAVRTCKFLSDGRRQIDAFYAPGDVFGVEVGAERRLTAEAIGDCTVVAYRWHGLDNLAANDEHLTRNFLSYTMRSLERARDHALLLGRYSAVQKLAAFLIAMAERHKGEEAIDLPMSRQDMADYLGLTIETVSRTLSQFERDGIIAIPTARRIHLKNRAALRHMTA